MGREDPPFFLFSASGALLCGVRAVVASTRTNRGSQREVREGIVDSMHVDIDCLWIVLIRRHEFTIDLARV